MISKCSFLTNIMLVVSITFLTIKSASAGDVAINFTGNIKSQTCTLENGAYTVFMGNFGTTKFSAPGDTSTPIPFYIGIVCPENSPNYVTVTFTGTASSDARYLALDDVSGGASGIAIRLMDRNNSPLSLNETSEVMQIQQGNIALPFSVQYVSLEHRSKIKAGVANGSLQFTINYL